MTWNRNSLRSKKKMKNKKIVCCSFMERDNKTIVYCIGYVFYAPFIIIFSLSNTFSCVWAEKPKCNFWKKKYPNDDQSNSFYSYLHSISSPFDFVRSRVHRRFICYIYSIFRSVQMSFVFVHLERTAQRETFHMILLCSIQF